MKNKEITKAHIQEAVNYIQDNKQERKVVMLRGCINKKGGVDLTYDCGDQDCPSCTNVRNIIKNQIENIFELMQNKDYRDIINI